MSEVTRDTTVFLGSKLEFCFVDLPCNVQLSGAEIDLPLPLTSSQEGLIFRPRRSLSGHNWETRMALSSKGRKGVAIALSFVEAETASSSLTKVIVHGAELLVTLSDKSGHTYPLIQFIQVRSDPSYSGRQGEVYL